MDSMQPDKQQSSEQFTDEGATPESFIRQTTSGLAIASLITAFLVPVIVPIVLGHLAKREIRNSSGAKSGSGLATAGLVLGYISLVGFIFLAATGFVVIKNLQSKGETSISSSSDYADGFTRGNTYMNAVNGEPIGTPDENCVTILSILGVTQDYTPVDDTVWTQGCIDAITGYTP